MVDLTKVAAIEKLETENIALSFALAESKRANVFEKELISALQSQLKVMTGQRDQFIVLAKGLDKDFNNGSIFTK